jgi:diguanylate cyclase (GGDEF)-like protein/PAS domain S-box-containing protein
MLTLRRVSTSVGVFAAFVFLLLVLEPFGSGASRAVGDGSYLGCAAAGCALAVVGARRRHGTARLPWFLFAGAEACWAIANGIWLGYDVVGRPVPVPSAFDVFYFSAAALLVTGVAVLARGTLRAASPLRVVLDGLLVVSSLFYVAWSVLLSHLPGIAWNAERALTWAYPIVDLALASVALFTLSRSASRDRSCWVLLAFGMLLLSGGDSVWAYANLEGGFTSGSPIDLAWVLGYLFIGVAALTDGGSRRSSEAAIPDRWTVFVPYAPFALVLVTAGTSFGANSDPVRRATGLVCFALIVLRQVLAVFENQRLAREMETRVKERTADLAKSEALMRAVGQSISDGVAVLGQDMTVRYASEGLLRIGGYRDEQITGDGVLRLVHPDDVAEVARVGMEVALVDGSSQVMHCRVRRADGSYGSAEVTMANLLDHPQINGHMLVIRDVSEQRALEDRLRHRAEHDDLTGLVNRTALVEQIELLIAGGRRPSVVLLDLDRFKALNDSLGHAIGDELLRAVAARLRHAVRPGDIVARLGGDEFAVVVDGDGAEGYGMAVRALSALEVPVVLGAHLVRSGASIGVTSTGATADELLRNADLAMYDAKSQGRNRVEVFHDGLHERLVRRVRLEEALRGAISRNEVHLVFQPVVTLDSCAVVGAEALLRWTHDGEQVDPGEFVSIAEESGLIIDIGRWVLEHACAEAAGWQRLRPDGPLPYIAVNVSVRQLVDSDLVTDVARALRTTGLDGACLTVELTESAVMEHSEQVIARLAALRQMGVRISIDDFGTGHSSLGRLQRLPVDEIKIDRSFVGAIVDAADRPPVVEAVLALARSLGLHVVAEGIETSAQLDALRAAGCRTGQGYLFGAGLPAAGIESRLAPEVDKETLNFSV